MVLYLVFMFAMVALWERVNRRVWGDLISPFNVLLFAWAGPLLIRGLNLSNLERPWDTGACWLVGWVTIALIAPCFLHRNNPSFQVESIGRAWANGFLAVARKRRLIFLVIVTYLISMTAYVYNEFVRNPTGIPLVSLAIDPTLANQPFHMWGIERESRSWALYLYPQMNLENAMIYVIGRTGAKRSWRLWIVISMLYPVMCILKLNRTDLMAALVPILIFEYYRSKISAGGKKPSRSWIQVLKHHRITVTAIALILLCVVAFERSFEQIRQGENAADLFQVYIGTDINTGSATVDAVLAQGYGYVGIPWENFVNTYENVRPEFRPGVGVLRPLYSLFGKGATIDRELIDAGFDPAEYIGAGYTGPINTYPFITILYLESGIVGILVGPLIYSIVVNWLYVRFRNEPSFLNTWLYVQVLGGWMWLFANANFTGVGFYAGFLYVCVLCWASTIA